MTKRTLQSFGETSLDDTQVQKAIFEAWPDNSISRLLLIAGTGAGAYIGFDQASKFGSRSPVQQALFVVGGGIAGNLFAQVLTMLFGEMTSALGPTADTTGSKNLEDARYLHSSVPTNKFSNIIIMSATVVGGYLGYYQASQDGSVSLAKTILMAALFALIGNIGAQALTAVGQASWGALGPDAA